ncbi:MAG TPA: PDZ domain-containing protein, partial [Gemmatimonadaceae bacterium]|nr:PDZ domain-containing protein [Gemmatimonadaceae bacterium]
GNAPWFTLALIGFVVLPLGVHAQPTPSVMVQPPTGWFGVRILDQVTINEGGNAFFDSYPVVTGVDSSSPAAKAGVRPGDVLLSFNSHDMRGGSVELAKWLKVGAPFVLRIRRNDATRVIRGTLGKRPENWERNMVVELTVPQMLQEQSGAIARPQIQRARMLRRMPVPEPLPALLPPALGYGGGVYPFAGAEFTALNQDLCDALGVKPEGVFVTNVIEGSAARAAGLRGGDVVVKADSIKIESPIDLVRAIRSADETDHKVDLQIIRKRKAQTLTLRW